MHPNHVTELGGRLSRSGGSEDCIPPGNHLQLNALNLQSSAPMIGDINGYKPHQYLPTARLNRPGWMFDENCLNKGSFSNQTVKRNPPRILEALPSYPQGGNGASKPGNKIVSDRISDKLSSRFNHDDVAEGLPTLVGHARSTTY